jgi:hypothetical protein
MHLSPAFNPDLHPIRKHLAFKARVRRGDEQALEIDEACKKYLKDRRAIERAKRRIEHRIVGLPTKQQFAREFRLNYN